MAEDYKKEVPARGAMEDRAREIEKETASKQQQQSSGRGGSWIPDEVMSRVADFAKKLATATTQAAQESAGASRAPTGMPESFQPPAELPVGGPAARGGRGGR